MPSTTEQLPLPFPHDPAYDPREFLPAESNHDARAWLERMTEWPDQRLVVWGPAGCGKTHLLRVWAGEAGAVRLAGPAIHSPEELPESGAVAIDDADAITRDEVFFHLLNTARDRGLVLLMAGRTPPARWPARLPDLTSRLRAVTAVEIGPPDDDLLRALLVRLLADRQMVVPPVLQDRLLRHLPRSAAALREAVATLDRISLGDGKPVTRTLVSRLLVTMAACQDDEDSITDGFRTSENLGHL
jgi:chromosomal replication initiation ATPase DnaA